MEKQPHKAMHEVKDMFVIFCIVQQNAVVGHDKHATLFSLRHDDFVNEPDITEGGGMCTTALGSEMASDMLTVQMKTQG